MMTVSAMQNGDGCLFLFAECVNQSTVVVVVDLVDPVGGGVTGVELDGGEDGLPGGGGSSSAIGSSNSGSSGGDGGSSSIGSGQRSSSDGGSSSSGQRSSSVGSGQ